MKSTYHLSPLLIQLRRAMVILLGKIDELLSRQTPSVIFCYHSINEDNWPYSISRIELEKQLDYLTSTRKPIRLSEILRFVVHGKFLPRPSFVLTFDDGYADILKAHNLLARRGIHPTVFALSHPQSANRGELATNRRLLTFKQLKSLSTNGWEIGCHGATHILFRKISDNHLYQETKVAKQTLEKRLAIKIKYFSYPKGNNSLRVRRAVKSAGFRLAVSTEDGQITTSADRFSIPRVGVDKTHSFTEFKYLASPSVIAFRRLVKTVFKI